MNNLWLISSQGVQNYELSGANSSIQQNAGAITNFSRSGNKKVSQTTEAQISEYFFFLNFKWII